MVDITTQQGSRKHLGSSKAARAQLEFIHTGGGGGGGGGEETAKGIISFLIVAIMQPKPLVNSLHGLKSTHNRIHVTICKQFVRPMSAVADIRSATLAPLALNFFTNY